MGRRVCCRTARRDGAPLPDWMAQSNVFGRSQKVLPQKAEPLRSGYEPLHSCQRLVLLLGQEDRVRRLANRSGYPIVAGKRPNLYVMNYPELEAWIEVAHGSLIQVNDATRR